MDYLDIKKVSYLYARDPSIISWNRGRLNPVNLEEELLKISAEDEEEYINVFLRIKGLSPDMKYYEIKGNELICKIPDGTFAARNLDPGSNMITIYSFSKIFGPESTQAEIFDNIVKQKLLDFINGRNSTILTYGTSGSGKTYTIVGNPDEPGIIPRSLEYIFRSLPELSEYPELEPHPNGEVDFISKERYRSIIQKKISVLTTTFRNRDNHVKTYKLMQQRLSRENAAELDQMEDLSISVWVSFCEIYNENIYDLLDTNQIKNQRKKLKLGSFNDSAFIRDLTSIHVIDGVEAFQILQYGLHNLNYASTGLNSHSSRSHGIFTIKLLQYSKTAKATQISCFNFCDLAGSERLKKTLNVGDRLKESNSINKSLHVLGRCIHNVRASQKGKHPSVIPFRDSKLTQLFQNALMGKENISIIINLNPATCMYEESRHALDFSAVTKEISIQEKPVPVVKLKNRFSDIIENERMLKGKATVIHLKEIDEDKERLEEMVVQLTNEIEQMKLEKEIEIREERDYVKQLYEGLIEKKLKSQQLIKELEIKRLRERHDEEIKSLKQQIEQFERERDDVINVSSSSSDISFSEKQKYEEEILRLLKENESLKHDRQVKDQLLLEMVSLKVEKEALVSQIAELKEEITRLQSFQETNKLLKVLEETIREKDNVISDAKTLYFAQEQELERCQKENIEIKIENVQLKETHHSLGMCYSCSASSDEDEESEKFCFLETESPEDKENMIPSFHS